MVNVSVSQLVNQVDKSHFTLYVEWQDTYFKILLLRSCMVPLSGEMHTENVNHFLGHLDESFETYLEKTKYAFSGENADVQFFLQDNTFTWKQQNILTRGEITVYPLSNILIISDTLKQLLELYQKCQERILTLEKQNEHLNKTNTNLVIDIEEMINKKITMEKDLYMKFLLLLNTKKKKIRELQEALDSSKYTKSVYNETTDDESEESDIESKKVYDTSAKPSNTKKHNMNESDQEATSKKSERNFKRCTNSFFSKDRSISPQPSTSKDKLTLQDTLCNIKSKQDSEEESEDLFSD